MLSARGVCQEEVFAQSCSHGSLLALEMRKAPLPWEPGAVLLGCSPWQDGGVQGTVQASALPVSCCDAAVWVQIRAAS